ncbi:ABC transporter permease [Bdellovibrio bacteriovorus]|uniref:ABC transporter permease n=1 Tax=Bdellovibrio bacteriovorus TaxID=959 RepID=UPI0021D3B35D|nr:ABC transporter permease [Bdellovibrio bacteriovorus]
MDISSYLQSEWPFILELTVQHISLVAVAVGFAVILGVPVGILMTRFRWLVGPLLGAATVVLTLPSIALFGVMIPIFAKFGAGLGKLPAITAVFLYSLLPILRNTYLAITNVDEGLKQAAEGIGMTFWQRLRWVDLPMSVPVILAGVRSAVVMNVGVMTIAAVIGAGGLGVLILRAISQSSTEKLIVGVVLVSGLAIGMDLVLQWLQKILTPKGIRR